MDGSSWSRWSAVHKAEARSWWVWQYRLPAKAVVAAAEADAAGGAEIRRRTRISRQIFFSSGCGRSSGWPSTRRPRTIATASAPDTRESSRSSSTPAPLVRTGVLLLRRADVKDLGRAHREEDRLEPAGELRVIQGAHPPLQIGEHRGIAVESVGGYGDHVIPPA